MIDLHAHPLPGLDDGPPTLDAALELARAAADAGTRTMVATPHIDHRHGVEPGAVAGAVAVLAGHLAEAGIPLELRAGGEVSLAMLEEAGPGALHPVRLGGGPWLLVDTPLEPTVPDFVSRVFRFLAAGERIALAHPERCPALRDDLGGLARLVDAGAITVMSAGSLTGLFGSTARQATGPLLEAGLVHALASDAHSAGRRPPAIGAAVAPALGQHPGLEAWLPWLTEDLPAAVVAGAPLPAPPPTPITRRGGLGRLLRRR